MVIVSMDIIINDPAKRDEIVALMKALSAANASIEGNIIHDWYANLWEPNRIRLYIEHESRETLLASEEQLERDPAWAEAMRTVFAHVESGALTLEFENNLRRYETGAELPPFAPEL